MHNPVWQSNKRSRGTLDFSSFCSFLLFLILMGLSGWKMSTFQPETPYSCPWQFTRRSWTIRATETCLTILEMANKFIGTLFSPPIANSCLLNQKLRSKIVCYCVHKIFMLTCTDSLLLLTNQFWISCLCVQFWCLNTQPAPSISAVSKLSPPQQHLYTISLSSRDAPLEYELPVYSCCDVQEEVLGGDLGAGEAGRPGTELTSAAKTGACWTWPCLMLPNGEKQWDFNGNLSNFSQEVCKASSPNIYTNPC